MGLSPLRLAAALVIGGVATGALYLQQQATGRPLPAATARPRVAATAPRPSASPAAKPALALPVKPRRIVLHHDTPGEVVLTVRGDELQVEFVAKAPAPPAKPPVKPVKVSARMPHLATPVATR